MPLRIYAWEQCIKVHVSLSTDSRKLACTALRVLIQPLNTMRLTNTFIVLAACALFAVANPATSRDGIKSKVSFDYAVRCNG